MKITIIENKKFAKISGDKNPLHLNYKFASKFFVKEPIVHGMNVVIMALTKFINKSKKKIFVKKLQINFINYIHASEEFELKFTRNNILVYNKLNNKIKINIIYSKYSKKITPLDRALKKKFNIKNLINNSILNELLFISYYAGTVKPGIGALINKVNLDFENSKILGNKKKINVKRKLKNFFTINYLNKHYKVNILANKLKPFTFQNSKTGINSYSLNKIKSKKILIFGSSSDIAKRLLIKKIKKKCKILNYSFRINFNNPKISSIEKQKLTKFCKINRPDFIFYLSSAPIYNGSLKENRFLFKFYKIIYVDYFKILLQIIKKNDLSCKIFYPSTIALDNFQFYKRLECYLLAKKIGENLCKKDLYKSYVKFFRIPQLISRSNYNLFGYYEGKKLSIIDNYINKFFKLI